MYKHAMYTMYGRDKFLYKALKLFKQHPGATCALQALSPGSFFTTTLLLQTSGSRYVNFKHVHIAGE
jgi:hypothetical protein